MDQCTGHHCHINGQCHLQGKMPEFLAMEMGHVRSRIFSLDHIESIEPFGIGDF